MRPILDSLRIALTAALLAAPASAGAAPLALADKDEIARIEAYLNGVRTLQARFVQSSSNGQIAEGRLYLERPGRVRLDYAPPSTLQVYADGYWLAYVDTALESVTQVPIGSTPAGFLVQKTVRLSGKVTVTGLERRGRDILVHVVQTDDPDAGSVVLVFDGEPLALTQWTVLDAQGVRTDVALVDPEINRPISDKVFEFDPDRYIHSGGGR